MGNIALAIHGGAGTILRSAMSPELEADYRSGLSTALRIGWTMLKGDASALDAVEATVASLEDFPLFNAGRGSVFTHEGKNEMDAAIMDGTSLKAGAVAFVRNVKNPIKLSRLVMEQTGHILLAGAGANQFALQMGVETADDAYFFTEHRYEQLLRARDEGTVQLDHTVNEPNIIKETAHTAPAGVLSTSETVGRNAMAEAPPAMSAPGKDGKQLGTVGAVACDSAGRLAAATSTGGMTNKKFGRVGDTALIGLGTYADDICAVSCTGHGEYFMRGVTAYDVAARMRYKGVSLEGAGKETIERLTQIGGDGGLIAVDRDGNITLPFNCEGMYRGFATAGQFEIEIYR